MSRDLPGVSEACVELMAIRQNFPGQTGQPGQEADVRCIESGTANWAKMPEAIAALHPLLVYIHPDHVALVLRRNSISDYTERILIYPRSPVPPLEGRTRYGENYESKILSEHVLYEAGEL